MDFARGAGLRGVRQRTFDNDAHAESGLPMPRRDQVAAALTRAIAVPQGSSCPRSDRPLTARTSTTVATAPSAADTPGACRATWRFIYTLSLAALLVTVTIALRRYDDSGLAPAHFWANKFAWNACADVVIAGDSRVYRGVCPAEFSTVLPQRRILNYGFDGAGYGASYLAGIDRVLDPNAASPMILLGLSPHSLTPRAVVESDFRERPKDAGRFWLLVQRLGSWPDELMRYFTPIEARELRTPWKHYYQEFHADGWVASARRPEQPDIALGNYRQRFDNNRVSARQINDLLGAISEWTGRGIHVFAFRPPTSRAMIELEDSLSGFDEAAFVRRFEAAGGVWLAVPQTEYHSYDGSHLRSDAACRLSSDLAQRMVAHLPAIAFSTEAE